MSLSHCQPRTSPPVLQCLPGKSQRQLRGTSVMCQCSTLSLLAAMPSMRALITWSFWCKEPRIHTAGLAVSTSYNCRFIHPAGAISTSYRWLFWFLEFFGGPPCKWWGSFPANRFHFLVAVWYCHFSIYRVVPGIMRTKRTNHTWFRLVVALLEVHQQPYLEIPCLQTTEAKCPPITSNMNNDQERYNSMRSQQFSDWFSKGVMS